MFLDCGADVKMKTYSDGGRKPVWSEGCIRQGRRGDAGLHASVRGAHRRVPGHTGGAYRVCCVVPLGYLSDTLL